jgi:hypothetical protein
MHTHHPYMLVATCSVQYQSYLFILYHYIVFKTCRLYTCACALYSSERFVRKLLH